ncbi:uncharacterized protein [Amphiura filiformis]|uniref:uncharacterized protein isoform X3 n=1 Tax=Amphiura filiformis TaxID=82378 RepID=UPI003B219C2C
MMQYIENQDLREWVKKSLRKTIVLKVHELAMQTGCEVLLKIRDEADNDGNFYYATESLQEEYSSKGLCKQSNEMCVSGETGMPVYPKVSIATQKDSEQPVAKSTKPVENATSTENNLEDDDSPLPLQLTVTDEQDVEEIRELEPKIKMEVVEDGESENDSMEIPIPSLLIGDDDTNDLAAAYGMEDMDNPSTLQVYLPSVAPKLYQCAICQKAFRSVQVLQKHTQAFHAKSSMSVRMKSKGAGVKLGRALAPKRHSCTVCSRNFPNVTLLNDHMSRSHMMASTNFQHASMEEQPQQFDNETSSSSDPTMPKISQVMSLQGGVMQISTATSSHSTFTMASPTSNPIFQSAGPSTSGASTSMSGIKPRSSTPARKKEDHQGPGEQLEVTQLYGNIFRIGDYVYTKDKTSAKGNSYFRCKSHKQFVDCKGRAIISIEADGTAVVKIKKEHTHEPVHVDIPLKMKKERPVDVYSMMWVSKAKNVSTDSTH